MSLPSATRFAELLGFVEAADAPAAKIIPMENVEEAKAIVRPLVSPPPFIESYFSLWPF